MDSHAKILFDLKLSAPGKVILFGEYSVVFNKPAIAATLCLRTKLHLSETNSDYINLNFSALKINKKFSLKYIEEFLKAGDALTDLETLKNNFRSLYKKCYESSDLTDAQEFSLITFFNCFRSVLCFHRSFDINIETDLPVGSGVGSSASFSVVLSSAAVIFRWYCEHGNVHNLIEKGDNGLTISEAFKREISELAMSCEKIFHGTPSGVDHNTILRGSMLEFIKTKDSNRMSQINAAPIKILLVNTNVPRSTKKLVGSVKQLKENHPDVIEHVLCSMESVAKNAVTDLIELKKRSGEDIMELEKHFGELVLLNHSLLRVLGISHPQLELIVSTAKMYGLSAKLTGAGGGGFAFVYLPGNVTSEVVEKIEKELSSAGCTPYNVTLGGPGLIIHEILC